MSRADLLAKIRKCLALAKGAGEHEAAAALAKARELMDAYGVDESEVAFLDVGEATSPGSATQRPPMWELTLVASVCRAIPVHALSGPDGITFVGLTPAPEIASYAFTVLFRQLKRARQDYIRSQLKRCGPTRKRQRADVFCEGWAAAVYSAVHKLYPKTDLDPLVRAYLDNRYSGLRGVEPRRAGIGGQVAANDRARGRAQGREVELQQGVGRAAPAAQLIDGRRA